MLQKGTLTAGAAVVDCICCYHSLEQVSTITQQCCRMGCCELNTLLAVGRVGGVEVVLQVVVAHRKHRHS